MKIASTVPFKLALVAASITTIGMIALDALDTTTVDRGVEPPYTCVHPRQHWTPPPQPTEITPQITIDDVAPHATATF